MHRLARTLACLVLLVPAAAVSTERIDGFLPDTGPYDAALIAELDRAVAENTYKQVNSVIVLRDGRLLVERYYNGSSRDAIHNPRSVGKTFASAVLGIALAGGYVDNVDRTLADFYDLTGYPNHDPKKAAVSLRQLITMTSGFDGFDFEETSVGNEENMYPQADWVRWTLALPMREDRAPGDAWRYFTAGIVVLGDILNRHLPGGLEAYAHAKLFAPLGIDNYEWQHTPQRVVNTAGGIQLTPLGFAKFGQLYKDGGRWNGVQVIPEAWVHASLTAHVDTVAAPNRYGYLWWIRDYEVGEERFPVAYCSGNGGNKIFVFKDHPLVVVVTASAYGQRYGHAQVDDLMERFVIPAVTPPFGDHSMGSDH